MDDNTKRRSNLGRGLSALFGESAGTDDLSLGGKPAAPKATLPIEYLHPGLYQPRRRFDDEAIQGLVESIRERGVIQPLLVRRDAGDVNSYEIIAGERRWRAAQMAGLHEVPVVIRDLTDRETLEIALIENIQRQDLTALEEAEGYKRLLDEFHHTQEDLGKVVGKSRSHVANMLRLLALPEAVRQMVDDGDLTAGHARALLTVEDPVGLAREVVKRGLNVRQTEDLARKASAPKRTGLTAAAAVAAARPEKDADLLALEQELTGCTGLKVSIAAQGKGGTLSIQYQTLDQLDDLLRRLRD